MDWPTLFYLQRGDTSGDNATKLVGEKYTQFNKVINRVFLLDKNNIVKLSIFLPWSEGALLGADYSLRDWVAETRTNLKPVFSNGFERERECTRFLYPIQ